MRSFNWAPEHSDALRQYRAEGMSYAAITDAINASFGTAYTRNAVLGRGRRMGLPDPDRSEKMPKQPLKGSSTAKGAQLRKTSEDRGPVLRHIEPPLKPMESVKLRCVGISPRLIPLIELEAGDCRYPYGGDKDGEAIVFCGHPQRPGSCYCSAHFHLTRRQGTASEPAAAPVSLRLVKAA